MRIYVLVETRPEGGGCEAVHGLTSSEQVVAAWVRNTENHAYYVSADYLETEYGIGKLSEWFTWEDRCDLEIG